MRHLVYALALTMLLVTTANAAEGHVPAAFPSLESAVRSVRQADFCGEPVPMHIVEVRERFEKELLLMLWDRAQVILWLKRSSRFFPHIERLLKARNMPQDLKYIAVIESALRTDAGSWAGAKGLWQFMPATGRKYGLTVNRRIDDRRNFFFATRAALDYLQKLHDQFGSWTMAAAAYNMGENGLGRAVKKQETDNFYRLHLPAETERYVLRAITAAMIMNNPERFGFDLRPEDYYPPVMFDRVLVKARRSVPIMVVAKAANTYYKTIKDLNPQLLHDEIPVGNHSVFLPEGATKGFLKRYNPVLEAYRKEHAPRTYRVRSGDSLIRIAHRFGLTLRQLKRLNSIDGKGIIHPGQVLRLE